MRTQKSDKLYIKAYFILFKMTYDLPKFSTSHGSMIVSPITALMDCERDANLGGFATGASKKSGSPIKSADKLFPYVVPAK